MNSFPPLSYIDCAAASDGGSLYLILSGNEGEFGLILDRGIDSETHSRIFAGDRLLSFAEEKVLLPNLEKLLLTNGIGALAASFVREFTDLIQSR